MIEPIIIPSHTPPSKQGPNKLQKTLNLAVLGPGLGVGVCMAGVVWGSMTRLVFLPLDMQGSGTAVSGSIPYRAHSPSSYSSSITELLPIYIIMILQ